MSYETGYRQGFEDGARDVTAQSGSVLLYDRSIAPYNFVGPFESDEAAEAYKQQVIQELPEAADEVASLEAFDAGPVEGEYVVYDRSTWPLALTYYDTWADAEAAEDPGADLYASAISFPEEYIEEMREWH